MSYALSFCVVCMITFFQPTLSKLKLYLIEGPEDFGVYEIELYEAESARAWEYSLPYAFVRRNSALNAFRPIISRNLLPNLIQGPP